MLVVIGQAKGDQQLSRRERGDFLIIVLVFGTFVASYVSYLPQQGCLRMLTLPSIRINTFSILTGQIMVNKSLLCPKPPDSYLFSL